jgi:hypothetical protein
MRRTFATGLVCLGVLALSAIPAFAMQFQPIAVSPAEVVVNGRGPIVAGDTDRLARALSTALQSGRTLLALALDSPGGNVAEAEQMVAVIRSRQVPVVIPNNSQCASACFLLLAASPRRFAATDALVGVHSASENGAETETSLAVTTLMQRDAADLGVPPSIFGKMAQTTAGRVDWLDPADLSLMHVTIYESDALAALRQPDPSQVRRDAAVPATPPAAVLPTPIPNLQVANPQPTVSPAFAAGRDDRRTWEIWVGGLHGAYREGAVFALTQMDKTPPGTCYGRNNLNLGDFTLGCDVARQRLAPVLAKLRSSAAYATGWNAPVPTVGTSESVEQEYQGVYFCGRQVAHLSLKVFQQLTDSHRRGLLVFGPNDNSLDVPRGSFIVEGIIGTSDGRMVLTPSKWVLQPPGYSWFGLTGDSDDGGKTFGGHLTDSSTCTRFTLARMRNATAGR